MECFTVFQLLISFPGWFVLWLRNFWAPSCYYCLVLLYCTKRILFKGWPDGLVVGFVCFTLAARGSWVQIDHVLYSPGSWTRETKERILQKVFFYDFPRPGQGKLQAEGGWCCSIPRSSPHLVHKTEVAWERWSLGPELALTTSFEKKPIIIENLRTKRES